MLVPHSVYSTVTGKKYKKTIRGHIRNEEINNKRKEPQSSVKYIVGRLWPRWIFIYQSLTMINQPEQISSSKKGRQERISSGQRRPQNFRYDDPLPYFFRIVKKCLVLGGDAGFFPKSRLYYFQNGFFFCFDSGSPTFFCRYWLLKFSALQTAGPRFPVL